MTEKKKEQALTTITGGGDMVMTPDTAIALQALQDRQVPADKVKTRPGRGGKVFSYVQHTYVTRILLDAMPQTYSHDVLECGLLPDGSAFARVRLMIHMPYKDNDGNVQVFTNTITEVGNFVGADNMPQAAKLSSAASRGLVKAFMRRFGVGLEFYKDGQEEWTTDTAWHALWNYIKSQLKPRGETQTTGMAQHAAKMLMDNGIGKDDLVDRFDDAYSLVSQWITEQRGEPVVVPEFEAPIEVTHEVALNMPIPDDMAKAIDGATVGMTWYDFIESESPSRAHSLLTKLASPGHWPDARAEYVLLQQVAAILLENLPEVEEEEEPVPKTEAAPTPAAPPPGILDDF